jgi:hypothetical protein
MYFLSFKYKNRENIMDFYEKYVKNGPSDPNCSLRKMNRRNNSTFFGDLIFKNRH